MYKKIKSWHSFVQQQQHKQQSLRLRRFLIVLLGLIEAFHSMLHARQLSLMLLLFVLYFYY